MPATQLLLPEIAAPDAVDLLENDFDAFFAQISVPQAANDCCPPVCEGAPSTLVVQVGGEGGTGNEKRKGRRPVHASAAARKAAYRSERARVDYTDAPHIVAKLRETAADLDCSVNELLQSMVRFAECNRNWKQVGLYGARNNGVLQ